MVWDLGDGWALAVDDWDFALAVPQTTGWPIAVGQHRFAVGLMF